ncbi:MAG: hypothetical protein KDN22_13805 [Verrucomicrobiae bacterium]|nr:hypothetical protein [Verrucomicrobiae bacterium]
MKNRFPIFAGAVTLGLSLGFATRVISHRLDDGRIQPPLAESPAGSAHGAGLLPPSRQLAEEAPGLGKTAPERELLSSSSGASRWLHWVGAAESATLADLPRLARLSEGRPAAISMLVARWRELDPADLLRVVGEQANDPRFPTMELAQELLDEWVKSDPAAVAAAMRDSESAEIHRWRHRVAAAIFKKDVELGLELLSEWGFDSYAPSMDKVKEWARSDPRRAMEFTLAHPAGAATVAALEAIGQEWGKSDPAAALAFASQTSSVLGGKMANAVLTTWAKQDLEAAGAWLAENDPSTLRRLAPGFVEVWAGKDPDGALSWSQAFLEGANRTAAVASVVRSLVKQDQLRAANVVDNLPASPERSAAALAVASAWFPRWGETQPVPPEAINWLSKLDSDSLSKVLSSISWQWLQRDRAEIADFLTTPAAGMTDSTAYSLVGSELARHDPQSATAWLDAVPENRAEAAAKAVFQSWQNAQADKAMAWLEGLSDSTRDQALRRGAVAHLVLNDRSPQSAEAIPEALRPLAREIISTTHMSAEQRTALLKIFE